MQGSFLNSPLFPMILMFVVLYFMLIRPQQKKAKETQQMQDNLKDGDSVLTHAGIFGTIVKIDGHKVTLRMADGGKIDFLRSTIAQKIEEKGEANS
jgi:preprotein translocase subunit YajC